MSRNKLQLRNYRKYGIKCTQVPDTGTYCIVRYQYVPVSVDTSTTEVYQYRSILIQQNCTRIGRYWYNKSVPVSVDTGTKKVNQYRSILVRYWCISRVLVYRTVLKHFMSSSIDTGTFFMYQYANQGDLLHVPHTCYWF